MFKWLSDAFNSKSYPKTISALSLGPMTGHGVNELHKRSISMEHTSRYSQYDVVEIVAKRCEDKTYDIVLQCQYMEDFSGVESVVMRCGLELPEAMRVMKEYDDKREAELLRGIPKSDHAAYRKRYIDPLRKKNNVAKLQAGMASSGGWNH